MTLSLLRLLGRLTHPLSRAGVGQFRVVQFGWRLFSRMLVGDVATITLAGVSLQIPTQDAFGMNVLLRGEWETRELHLFREQVRSGTIVDVGAHVGLYGLIAAAAMSGRGRVVAFEPAPRNYDLLARNIEANGFRNISAVQKAVSNKVGTLDFYEHPIRSELHSLRPLRASQSPSRSVEVTSLDEFFGEEQVDLVKMDVEGAEGHVLEGMSGLIRRNPQMRLFTEFNPSFLSASGTDPEAFIQSLIGNGFSLHEISQSEDCLIPFNVAGVSRIPAGEGIDLMCAR